MASILIGTGSHLIPLRILSAHTQGSRERKQRSGLVPQGLSDKTANVTERSRSKVRMGNGSVSAIFPSGAAQGCGRSFPIAVRPHERFCAVLAIIAMYVGRPVTLKKI